MKAHLSTVFLLLTLAGFVSHPGWADQHPPTTAQEYIAAGNQARRSGNYLDGEKAYLAAIELAKQSNDSRLVTALSNLAMLYQQEGKRAEAIERMKEAIAATEQVYGPGDYRMAMSLSNLAMMYESGHQLAEAESSFKQGLEVAANVEGPQRSFKYAIVNNLAEFYMHQKRYEDAEALLKPAIQELEGSDPPQGRTKANLSHLLAVVYEREGKPNESEALEGQVHDALQASQNPHVDPAYSAWQRGMADQRAGQLQAAEADYQEVIDFWQKAQSDNDYKPYYPGLLPAGLEGLGDVYVAEKRNTEAEDLFKKAIGLTEQYASPATKQGRLIAANLRYPFHLQNLYQEEGRLNEMEPVYERALVIEEKVLGPKDRAFYDTLVNFAHLYLEEGKSSDAMPLYQRALEIQAANEGATPALWARLDEYASLLHELYPQEEAANELAREKKVLEEIDAQNKQTPSTPVN